MRSIPDIEADLFDAQQRRREVDQVVYNFERELVGAKIAAADHPLLGKRVTRIKKTWKNEKKLVGTACVYVPAEHHHIRGLYARPGDVIVVSDTGKSAWDIGADIWTEVVPTEQVPA